MDTWRIREAVKTTTMTQSRAGTTLRTGIAVYLENMSFRQASELGGQSPYDSFWGFTTGGQRIDVRRGDLFTDENEVDPLTNANTQYLVFGNPEIADLLGDVEIPFEKFTGN